jgi:hypothetical protein
MSSLALKPLKSYGNNNWVLGGSFRTNGTSSPVAAFNQSNRGSGVACGFSVVRTGVGVYRITFDDTVRFATMLCDVTGTTFAHAQFVQRNVVVTPGAKTTIDIRTYDVTGAAVDIASGTDNSVRFFGILSDGVFR